jgi:hypothetical protein
MADIKRRIIDKRLKEKFMMDDTYLNGQAKLCGWQGTIVYLSLCRHASKDQECFPSIKLMSEEHNVNRKTILKGIEKLEERNVIEVEKTRTKKGQWLNNVYILRDKSEWDYTPIHVRVEDTVHVRVVPSPSPCGGHDQVPVEDTKETHKQGNTYKETHTLAKQSFAGKDINNLIELFRPLNPNVDDFFKNKTERKAIEDMLSKFGLEKLTNTIKALPDIVCKRYAPKITKPSELKRDLGKLLIFVEQEKGITKGKEFIY